MKPQLHRVGMAQTPVVIADDVTGTADAIVDLAARLAPFPPAAGNHYPGLRQPIGDESPAFAYVQDLLERAAPLIGGAFDADAFDLIEASFSLVTTHPARLQPPQRAPHFDSTDPNHLAIMHYLRDTPGTAFFRQRATGIELVGGHNVAAFIDTASRVAPDLSGYVSGSGRHYAEIGRVAGIRDRLVIYPGALLHSGLIEPTTPLSDDPRRGRLTANLFVRLHPSRQIDNTFVGDR